MLPLPALPLPQVLPQQKLHASDGIAGFTFQADLGRREPEVDCHMFFKVTSLKKCCVADSWCARLSPPAVLLYIPFLSNMPFLPVTKPAARRSCCSAELAAWGFPSLALRTLGHRLSSAHPASLYWMTLPCGLPAQFPHPRVACCGG